MKKRTDASVFIVLISVFSSLLPCSQGSSLQVNKKSCQVLY